MNDIEITKALKSLHPWEHDSLRKLLSDARAEGRAAGLEEARVKVASMIEPQKECWCFECARDAIAALAMSAPREKMAKDDDRLPCGCRETDGCEDAK